MKQLFGRTKGAPSLPPLGSGTLSLFESGFSHDCYDPLSHTFSPTDCVPPTDNEHCVDHYHMGAIAEAGIDAYTVDSNVNPFPGGWHSHASFPVSYTRTPSVISSDASSISTADSGMFLAEGGSKSSADVHSLAVGGAMTNPASIPSTKPVPAWNHYSDDKVAVRYWDDFGKRAAVELNCECTGLWQDFADRKASTHGSNKYELGKVQCFCYDCEYTVWCNILLKDKVRSPVLRNGHHCIRSGTKSSKANRTPGRKRPNCRLAHAGPCLIVFSNAYSETEPLPANPSVLTSSHVSFRRRRKNTPTKRPLSKATSSDESIMGTAAPSVRSVKVKRRRMDPISKGSFDLGQAKQLLEEARLSLELVQQRCTDVLTQMPMEYTRESKEVELDALYMCANIAAANNEFANADAYAQRAEVVFASLYPTASLG